MEDCRAGAESRIRKPLRRLENGTARTTHLALDQQRESAQIAAKERSTSWAMRKAG